MFIKTMFKSPKDNKKNQKLDIKMKSIFAFCDITKVVDFE